MAQYFKRIVGIELCEQAVIDARYNAEANGIKNVEYICAKIEDAMKGVFNKIGRDEEVVAVLDPPRTGVRILLYIYIYIMFLNFIINFIIIIIIIIIYYLLLYIYI